MQINTRMRYCFTPARMVIIKKSDNNKVCKDVEKSEPSYMPL